MCTFFRINSHVSGGKYDSLDKDCASTVAMTDNPGLLGYTPPPPPTEIPMMDA